MLNFRTVPFEDIDIVKWNSCVHYAANGNVFGYYWFLKNTIKEWDAIVLNDYEAVFAIPRNIDKSGHQLSIQTPHYLRELGLYSTSLLDVNKVAAALDCFPENVPHVRIALNLGNPTNKVQGFDIVQLKNYTISLYKTHEFIRNAYTPEFKDIKSVESAGMYLDNQIKVEELVNYIFMTQQQDWDRHTAMRIIYNALHRGIGMLSVLRDRNSKILAAGFFISSHGRIVHLFSASHHKNELTHRFLLFDSFVRSYANRPLIFDLNMGENPLALGMGAESYEYPVLTKMSAKKNWVSGLFSSLFQNQGT